MSFSCGEILLKNIIQTYDYSLRISDEKKAIIVPCHKCILITQSKRLRDAIQSSNSNYFHLGIALKPGYIKAFLQVLNYMYLRNHSPFTPELEDKRNELFDFFEINIENNNNNNEINRIEEKKAESNKDNNSNSSINKNKKRKRGNKNHSNINIFIYAKTRSSHIRNRLRNNKIKKRKYKKY